MNSSKSFFFLIKVIQLKRNVLELIFRFFLFFFIGIIFFSSNILAQADTRFYCPPINDYNNQPYQLVLSTSFPTATVTVRSPAGVNFPATNYVVVNGTPTEINFNTQIAALGSANGGLQNNFANTVQSDAGFIITSDNPITVYLKPNRNNNQEIIPLKGSTGLGTTFRAASQTLTRNGGCGNDLEQNSHFVSVMATENGTTVNFDNPNAGGFNGSANPVTYNLNAGQSVMIQTPLNTLTNQITGTLIRSNRPISVTSGGQHIGASAGAGACDAGIDNLVPIEELGTDYIFARGNGNASNSNQDYAFVVAHTNNTQVFLNGVLQGTINAGQYINMITPNVAAGTPFYIRTSQPAYAFHVSSQGANEMGMSLLPRLICTGARYINFQRQTGLNNRVYVVIPTSALPSFRLNGNPFTFYGVTPQTVIGIAGWSVITFQDANIANNNVMTADRSFHVGLLAADASNTGLYGFLSNYNVDIQSFDPSSNLPSNSYNLTDLCAGLTIFDTMIVTSCAPPNVIDSIYVNPPSAGVATIEVPFGPDNPVYSLATNPGFSGPVTLQIFISNALGHEITVTTSLTINPPIGILAGSPNFTCDGGATYTILGSFIGTPPFTATGTGAPGTWSGNNWTSAPIPAGTPYNVTIVDTFICNPPVNWVGNSPYCIQLQNDTVFCIDGTVSSANLINVLLNDIANNTPINISDVTLNVVSPDPTNSIDLNVSSGNISINSITNEGLYSLSYQVCESSNPSNCRSANVYVYVRPNLTFSLSPLSDCGANDGIIEIENLVPFTSYSLSINGSVSNIVPSSSSYIINALPVGNYDIIITNLTSGCNFLLPNLIIQNPEILQSPFGIGCD